VGAYPQGVDWNNDGKLDLMAGDSTGHVWFFQNIGTKQAPKLAEGVQLKAGGQPIIGTAPRYEKGQDGLYRLAPNTNILIGIYSKIHFGDWNGDGLIDLLVGQDGPGEQKMLLYLNAGTAAEPALAKPTVLELPEPALSRPSPYLLDWDGDGRQDLLCGTERAAVYFFRNIGAQQQPKLAKGVPLELRGADFEQSYRCRIAVTDWNNDGKLDLLVGNFYSHKKPAGGNVWLFLGK